MRSSMRSAMAMIELIFAIVIIAISVMTIPSMMNIADQASKGMAIDDDALKRMRGELLKVFQSRWDQNSSNTFGALVINNVSDLNCSRSDGSGWKRVNPDSAVVCDDERDAPVMAITPITGNKNLSQGVEQLNDTNYSLNVNTFSGTSFPVTIQYQVRYVDSNISNITNGVATATWTIGSSQDMIGNASNTQTHLKRIVARCTNPDSNLDMTFTFFKSNISMDTSNE